MFIAQIQSVTFTSRLHTTDILRLPPPHDRPLNTRVFCLRTSSFERIASVQPSYHVNKLNTSSAVLNKNHFFLFSPPPPPAHSVNKMPFPFPFWRVVICDSCSSPLSKPKPSYAHCKNQPMVLSFVYATRMSGVLNTVDWSGQTTKNCCALD